ncbi:hypothetical protein KSS87_011555, partial [Heliosperma pusillum]
LSLHTNPIFYPIPISEILTSPSLSQTKNQKLNIPHLLPKKN